MDVVYVDTCVYRDQFEGRKGISQLIPQDEEARDLFERVKTGEFMLATSDHLEKQLSGFQEYTELVKELDGKKQRIHVTTTDADKAAAEDAAQKGKTEYEDALHFVLAMKAKAKWFATQNEKHYAAFNDRIKVRRPRLVGVF